MLNDLTCFAAVPGAEQERFQQLFEAASDKFRQRFAAPTPSAASGGSSPAAVHIAFFRIPPGTAGWEPTSQPASFGFQFLFPNHKKPKKPKKRMKT